MPTLAEVAQYPDKTPIQFPVSGKITNLFPPQTGEYGTSQGLKIADGSTLEGKPVTVAVTVCLTDDEPTFPAYAKGQEITVQARWSEHKQAWVGAKKGTGKGERGPYPKITVYGPSLAQINQGQAATSSAQQSATTQERREFRVPSDSKQSQGQAQISIGPTVQIAENEAVAAFFRGFGAAAEKFGYMGGPDSWENMTPEEHGTCRAVGREILRGVASGFIQPSKAAPSTRAQSAPPTQPSRDKDDPGSSYHGDDDDIPF